MGDITSWLRNAALGDRDSFDRIFEALYPHLHALAEAKLSSHERTLNPTALIHECYLRLFGNTQLELTDRQHFLACAGRAMRAVIVDHYRVRNAQKRGGAWVSVSFNEQSLQSSDELDWQALNEALDALNSFAPAQRELVELHFFAGVEFQEIARIRQVDERTVRRHWQRARAFLHAQLQS
jgi:RNA polymerase sigma factor (TIGR02999 family)